MRALAVITTLFLSLSALAIPPDASFDGMQKLKGGNTLLTYSIHEGFMGGKYELIDDDGVATLATIQYLLIQGPIMEMYFDKAKWKR